MRYIILIIVFAALTGCSRNAYYGYVYDFESKQPIENVEINDYMNSKMTVTNSEGYFFLKHDNKISGKLIFKKPGYDIDTLETIRISNGEKMQEKFKGDTVYLFDQNSTFRDSIVKINK